MMIDHIYVCIPQFDDDDDDGVWSRERERVEDESEWLRWIAVSPVVIKKSC